MPLNDTDFGWHYRCGEEFLTQKKLCTKNEFSYFLPDYKAAYNSFLFDVPLAFFYDHFGFTGLSIFYSFLMTIIGILFINLISGFFWIKNIAFWLTFFLSYKIFGLGLRVQIFSYLFFLITLFVLQKSKQKPKYLFFLVPLMIFWANIHLSFFIGLAVLIFYTIDNALNRKTTYEIPVLVLCFLATFINPFGINIYREIFLHATSPLGTMIAEWVAPSIYQKILIVCLTSLYFFQVIKSKKVSIFRILMVLFSLFLGLSARRNLALFYITFFFVYFEQKTFFLKEFDEIILPLLVCAFCFVLIVNVPKTIDFNSSWKNYCDRSAIRYPCEAIKNYPELSGNVYAAYEWGGFLIWQKPQIKVFADGRMPAWRDADGKSPYQVYLEIIQTQPGWNEKLNSLKTDYLLIANGTFLDLLLKEKSKKYHWQEVYRNKYHVIYKNLL